MNRLLRQFKTRIEKQIVGCCLEVDEPAASWQDAAIFLYAPDKHVWVATQTHFVCGSYYPHFETPAAAVAGLQEDAEDGTQLCDREDCDYCEDEAEAHSKE